MAICDDDCRKNSMLLLSSIVRPPMTRSDLQECSKGEGVSVHSSNHVKGFCIIIAHAKIKTNSKTLFNVARLLSPKHSRN